MTTFAAEKAKHDRWMAAAWEKPFPIFEHFLINEFRPAHEHNAALRFAIADTVRFSVENVPYYANLFSRLGLTAGDVQGPADLPKLPILRKETLVEQFPAMQAVRLRPGDRPYGSTKSSGTTGRPVSVTHSYNSQVMFSFQWVRQARWFGMEPHKVFLEVRIPSELRRTVGDGPPQKAGLESVPYWRYLGQFFQTGIGYGFPVEVPVEQHLTWLRQVRPSYTQTYPGVYEEWALAADGRKPVESLEAIIATGSQLTDSLRRRLEEIYRIPVHQTYGLNEVGKVAFRCEAGRYHILTEHCFVEIVRPDGQPCQPGETGHVVVTTFQNSAMPLFRYDTGDMGRPAEGPCTCGRTLPSFQNIEGRFRRYAGLPPDTRLRVNGLIEAVETFPPTESGFLRRYQIHQDRQNRFTLRLYTVSPVPEKFFEHVRRKWDEKPDLNGTFAGVTETEEIVDSPSGKRLDFISDLSPDPYGNPNATGNG